jgi:hypothetical protein
MTGCGCLEGGVLMLLSIVVMCVCLLLPACTMPTRHMVIVALCGCTEVAVVGFMCCVEDRA